MVRSFRILGGLVLSVVALVAGCGNEKTLPEVKAPAAATTAPEAKAPEAGKDSGAKEASLNISDDILATCKIRVDNLESAPKFELDTAEVAPQEKDVLEKLASCLTTGPLKGKSVQLIGRADARGEVQYNMALGARRAKSVAAYLGKLGVEEVRLKQTSRGELDATGTTEDGWAKDRRVDIKLSQ
jgi:peptidoglycan-associated lipoprotein